MRSLAWLKWIRWLYVIKLSLNTHAGRLTRARACIHPKYLYSYSMIHTKISRQDEKQVSNFTFTKHIDMPKNNTFKDRFFFSKNNFLTSVLYCMSLNFLYKVLVQFFCSTHFLQKIIFNILVYWQIIYSMSYQRSWGKSRRHFSIQNVPIKYIVSYLSQLKQQLTLVVADL